ncbi:MAG: hypothetical protein QNJ11_03720 [Woeseiaceae bacterium]|nr:hypothetical protein [Woeseiaceae bacterium]
MNLPLKELLEDRDRLALALGWLFVFACAVLVYLPGLSGPFLLDDFGSVAAMGNYGGVRDWETFKSFVFNGHAGPTGRPLSLLTFLIDAQDWPAEAWPFKRTNLVIHILNGALLGFLIHQLLRVLGADSRKAGRIACLAAACWLLHPFLVSTTLYVVQRMSQLATMFILAGLIGYTYGRGLVSTAPLKAYLLMSVSLAIGTLLATFSKENGLLLPLLAGVLELAVLSNGKAKTARLNRAWLAVFVVAPTAVIFAYLLRSALISDFFNAVPPRDYSLYERLLTQPRVLADYLQNWFLPKLYTTGVFQDHFLKSTSLLAPVTTLFSTLLHAALVAAAFLYRQRFPLFTLAVLFFFGAHLIESTVLNLELYFEHRNYLAAVFLFLPLIALMHDRLDSRTYVIAGIAMLALLGGFTRYSATVWQDMSSMVEVSARKAPTSARAQGRYATDLFNAGYREEALAVLDRAIAGPSNDHPLLTITRLNILCAGEQLTSGEIARAVQQLGGQFYDPRSIRLYTVLVSSVGEQRCPEVTARDLQGLFNAMLEVPFNADPTSLGYSHLKYFMGRLHIYKNEPAAAVHAFEASLASRPGASHAMLMAALLASSNYFEEALHISDLAITQLEADRRSTLNANRVSEADILAFRATVRADLDALREHGIANPGD